MPNPKLVIPEPLSLKSLPEFTEKWLEDQIVENPSLLNLGEVEVRGRQRAQPRAGRLDLLLEDTESRKRYEVEIQLGKTDESHIIAFLFQVFRSVCGASGTITEMCGCPGR